MLAALPMLFAQLHGWSMADLAIWIVVLVVVFGIVVIVIRQAQIPIPSWIWQILGLVLIAIVAILAIKFVVSL